MYLCCLLLGVAMAELKSCLINNWQKYRYIVLPLFNSRVCLELGRALANSFLVGQTSWNPSPGWVVGIPNQIKIYERIRKKAIDRVFRPSLSGYVIICLRLHCSCF